MVIKTVLGYVLEPVTGYHMVESAMNRKSERNRSGTWNGRKLNLDYIKEESCQIMLTL